ncbi:hypothetical protein KIN20_002307 [Parelaphostrongylus tenuis]|uniref:Nose resistant-to-fluoxetine protein N-terminal domain-containing protein n=1 Tax=Parelaphostrongylus tenuis TaxID=148309 RepID=A0AAD5LUZ6_PARTN|nr:hypothetical protein KIN20_002307 [Parelaphostrongylus tenuis]
MAGSKSTPQAAFDSDSSIFASFADSNGLLNTNVSQQCMLDMMTFSKSLLKFISTTRSCVKHGGCDSSQKKALNENIYAVKQLDAFGKLPAGILELTTVSTGSYVECNEVQAPYETHYCFAKMQISKLSADAAVEKTNYKDVPKLMSSVIEVSSKITHLPLELVPVEFPDAVCVPKSVEPTVSFWIFIVFASFLVLWAILSTITDYVLHTYNSCNIKTTTAMTAFLASSFYSNSAVLLDVRPAKEGILRSLASIRFISMTWVAAGHTIKMAVQCESLLPLISIWDPLLSTTFANAFFSVDTFFLLSGILVAYTFMKLRPTAEYVKNPINWVLYYVHRYLRLTPSLMIFIWFFVVVFPFTNGPWNAAAPLDDFETVADNVRSCQQHWWRNMLYINNFFADSEHCYSVSWYLAVDTQLYMAAPVFLITLYISPLIGYATLILCSARQCRLHLSNNISR